MRRCGASGMVLWLRLLAGKSSPAATAPMPPPSPAAPVAPLRGELSGLVRGGLRLALDHRAHNLGCAASSDFIGQSVSGGLWWRT